MGKGKVRFYEVEEPPQPSYHELANQEVAPAYDAVNQAIKAYYEQPWYVTAYARVRFALFWVTYWLRMKLALFIIKTFAKDDTDAVRISKRVTGILGV